MSRLTDEQYLELKDELTVDPYNMGYAAAAPSDFTLYAELCNTAREGAPEASREIFAGYEFWAVTVPAEFAALWDDPESGRARCEIWLQLCSYEEVNAAAQQVKLQGAFVWTNGTQTRQNLEEMRKRTLTRSEELFGEDLFVTASECRIALTEY